MTNSIIKEVSIYRQGSYISRLGTIKVNKGKHNTLIDTLPSSLNPSTISLYLPDSVKGSNVQIKHYDESQRNEILKEINNKLINIENKIIIKQNQIELWNKNADFSNSNNTSFEQISNYLDNLPKRLEEIYQEINKLNDEKEILLKEKEEKEKQSNQYLLTVDIESDNDQDINYQIKYFDNNPKAGSLYSFLPLLFSYFQNLMLAYYAPNRTDQNALASYLDLKSVWGVKDYLTGLRNYTGKKTLQILQKLREIDAKSKGLDNPSTSSGDLMKELIFFILH